MLESFTSTILQLVSFGFDGYFSMMSDRGDLRSDLKLTSICQSHGDGDDVRAMLNDAEQLDKQVVVSKHQLPKQCPYMYPREQIWATS